MKRDFSEEYKSHIEADMPDLWDRIEQGLTERAPLTEEPSLQETVTEANKPSNIKRIRFMKTATLAAAGICVLVVGIRVFNIIGTKSSESPAPMENGSAADAAMEAPPMWEEGASEPPMVEEAAEAEYDEAPLYEPAEAAPAATDDSIADSDAGKEMGIQAAGAQNSMTSQDMADNGETSRGMDIEIGWAFLVGISKVSSEMEEAGFVYAYEFRLVEEDTTFIVYLTDEMYRQIEEEGIAIERQAAYALTVTPMPGQENEQDSVLEESILKKIKKLP
ncbi:MAG: hypothetical protein J1E61_00935 [Lachnospiraceae bacterium]|nr:hypothetical protein [Lachnospiraceae bacterium]